MKTLFSKQLISILIPVYNAALYLESCIESIEFQSYHQWELLAVDDSSEDNSYDILEACALRLAQKGFVMKVFRNNLKGIVPALELAYANASGEYITRMDADDIMPKDKLQRLANTLFHNPDSCVTGKVEYFSEDKLGNGFIRYADWLNSLIDTENHYSAIYKECIIPSPCWMMHRKTLEKIGGITADVYPEDYDLCFRLYKHNITIMGVDTILHLWRDHGERASRNDPNYLDQHFLDLKLHYFQKLDRQSEKELILWGAGKTGKLWARALVNTGHEFRWMTGNTKKIGHNIFGVIVEDDAKMSQLNNAQIICAIKEKGFAEANKDILQNLQKLNEVYFMY